MRQPTPRHHAAPPRVATVPVSLAVVALMGVSLLAVACGGDTVAVGPGTTEPRPTTVAPTTAPTSELAGLSASVVTDDLTEPVAVTGEPGSDRVIVSERAGRIVAVDNDGEVEVVLDLTDEVGSEGPEQGLLSVAFHPGYPHDGGAFVYLVTAGDDDTELREYHPVDGQPGRLDPSSARTVLAISQPHEWHNGGTVTFGPDGYLYLSLGDGGGIGDPHGNGQDPATILGGVVRIDVDAAEPYAIPPDNPFVGGGGARELWVYGLRNPWRIAIDPATDTMVIADVGQDRWEDINVASLTHDGGTNFGWPVIAGPECFQNPVERRDSVPPPECDPTGFRAPALSVDRPDGCAIIGGPVYRGAAIPELAGHYFYSDYCRGWLRSLPVDDAVAGESPDWTEHLDDLGRITSIGTDAHGEMFVTDQDGSLYRIEPIRTGDR